MDVIARVLLPMSQLSIGPRHTLLHQRVQVVDGVDRETLDSGLSKG
jgi:hypothetical protein